MALQSKFMFDLGNAQKVQDFVITKAPPTIYSQNPPAHTPLTEGMVVEVKTISPSDIPIKVLNPDLPEAVKDVPIDVINGIFETDPDLKALGASASLNDSERTIVAEKVNAGLAKQGFGGNVTSDDAFKLTGGLQKVNFFK